MIIKEKAADVTAIGAMPCQTKAIFSGMLGRLWLPMASRIIQAVAMITWMLNRPKYHRLYLVGMLQMDSLSSLGFSCSFSSSGLSGPSFCATPGYSRKLVCGSLVG